LNIWLSLGALELVELMMVLVVLEAVVLEVCGRLLGKQ
jgi:hypothetical protein